MADRLGICVSRRDCLPHVVGLARAAVAYGKEVFVFFTGEGVFLTKDPLFSEVLKNSRVGVCEVSYNANGFKGEEVPGLVYKDFVTQAFNSEMVEECDRYIIL